MRAAHRHPRRWHAAYRERSGKQRSRSRDIAPRLHRASVTQAKIATGMGGTLVPAAPTRMEIASVVTWVTNDATSNTINRALNLVLSLAVTFVSHLPPRPRHDAQEDAYQSR